MEASLPSVIISHMSIRKVPFANNEFYHIFNRGVEKRQIFMDNGDSARFLQGMDLFNALEPIGSIFENSFRKHQLGSEASNTDELKRLVDFVCFCINPNHFHFILKQLEDRGIEKFMHRLSTGYTKYFNIKHKRNGVLFQGPFKAVHIETNEQLLHTSVYVNLNFKVHQLGSEASKYFSSWDEYVGKNKYDFCNKKDILDQFKNEGEYKIFAEKTLRSIQERRETLRELEE